MGKRYKSIIGWRGNKNKKQRQLNKKVIKEEIPVYACCRDCDESTGDA